MYDFARHDFEYKSAVYSDIHDFGVSEEEEKKVRGFNPDKWFDLERSFCDVPKK